MLTADPEVTGLADRLGRRFGSLVGVTVAIGAKEQLLQLEFAKASQPKVDAQAFQLAQLDAQQFLVPARLVAES